MFFGVVFIIYISRIYIYSNTLTIVNVICFGCFELVLDHAFEIIVLIKSVMICLGENSNIYTTDKFKADFLYGFCIELKPFSTYAVPEVQLSIPESQLFHQISTNSLFTPLFKNVPNPNTPCLTPLLFFFKMASSSSRAPNQNGQ